jgi:mono/diheme cytochrome c family protein
MLASMVNPHDGYATLREQHYCSGDASDWDRLPEWNPAVESIAASELDAPGGASATSLTSRAQALALAMSPASEDDPALVALGRVAFSRYPVQLAAYMSEALASRDAAAHYGVWVDGERGVGGLVRVRMPDGSGALAVTCATCHTARITGALVDGAPNAALDPGDAMIDAAGGSLDPATAMALAAWGPGRLDVTTSTGEEPVRISDLRPVAWLGYLQHDATVKKNDLTTLAIRIETLVTTSREEQVRPPRLVALALAAYVTSLANSLPDAAEAASESADGAAIFASQCAGCHVPPGLTGMPVPLETIGTDPTLGLSPSRGTGAYRVPSLHGVGTRGPLLHDGTVPSVQALFDPARPTPAYTSRIHGAGAVSGHPFALDLRAADRAALVAYVQAL